MRALITGGAGFIGSHLADARRRDDLEAAGVPAVVLVLLVISLRTRHPDLGRVDDDDVGVAVLARRIGRAVLADEASSDPRRHAAEGVL